MRLLLLFFLALSFSVVAEEDPLSFDDFPVSQDVEHPDWFKRSFLDLPDDLKEAAEGGKQGLIVYFGQRHCAYCRQLMRVNFAMDDIVTYTRKHFDVVAIDIWGEKGVVDMQGQEHTERSLALQENTNFTPSLIFYDAQGKQALRLRGYYPPYQFRAALEYVADAHYQRETFKEFLARGEDAMVFELGDLNEEEFFSLPPHNLDRSRFPSQRPLVVFFEQGNCHACDVLHGHPLQEKEIRKIMQSFDTVQLDVNSQDPVITPAGKKSNAHQWASDLGVFYTPSLLIYDEKGREILRVDSVVNFYRLRNILNFVSSKAYLTQPSYQQWRIQSQIEDMKF